MNKQVQAIRTEIERQKKHYLEREEYDFGWDEALNEIASFIDSLPEEKPSKSLEEELNKWRHIHFDGERDGDFSGEWLMRKTQLKFAQHFYELGQASVPMPEDTVIFQKGVAEGKRLMMEDAVEYEVFDFSSSLERHPVISISLDNKKYRSGDKVKIIIVKED